MRIAAVSDTHGYIDEILNELKRQDLDMILFAGDHYRDGLKLGRKLKLPCHAVAGNCDKSEVSAPENQWLIIEGQRIWLLHGHRYQVKQGLNTLWYAASEKAADIVVFGHTHWPYCEEQEGIWLVNPGAAGLFVRAGERPSWANIEIEKEKVKAEIVRLS